VRVIAGTAALLAVAAVLALAMGTRDRLRLPAGASQRLLRITPAAAFAVEQTLPQYHQVNYLYTPAEGFYPLAPLAGFAVPCAYAAIALGPAGYLPRSRDT
jgi:hypothetical protein